MRSGRRPLQNRVTPFGDVVAIAQRGLFRGPHRSTYPGLWSFPGDHVEQAETLAEALVREVRRRSGLPRRHSPFSEPSRIRTQRRAIRRPITCTSSHMYVVPVWDGGEPALRGDEHTELCWS